MPLDLYKTELRDIRIKNLDISLHCISNIDDVYNALLVKPSNHEDVQDERIPYWTELWPSAIALAEYLVDNNFVQKNQNVLEIGCGLGLPGITAAKMGGLLTFTDYMQAPLDFAKKNCEINNIHNAEFKIFDWRKPDISISHELILASDIAYESRSFDSIISAFTNLLKPGVKMILTEPNRKLAVPLLEKIEEKFKVRRSITSIDLKGIKTTINILEISSFGRVPNNL